MDGLAPPAAMPKEGLHTPAAVWLAAAPEPNQKETGSRPTESCWWGSEGPGAVGWPRAACGSGLGPVGRRKVLQRTSEEQLTKWSGAID